MATRSNIGYVTPKGTIRFVYCHWDGYFESLGRDLIKDFNSLKLAIDLVERGDMSYLDKSYASMGDKWEMIKPREVKTIKEVCEEEFCYIYIPDFGWFGKEVWDDSVPFISMEEPKELITHPFFLEGNLVSC